jgi:UPF0716 protein FxsA
VVLFPDKHGDTALSYLCKVQVGPSPPVDPHVAVQPLKSEMVCIMWALAIILSVPVIEIALFILVGGWIGVVPTLALVLLSVFAGVILIRGQGGRTAAMMRQGVLQADDPSEKIVHGAMIFLAAMLLIIPGFLTDAVGLVLLVPQVRRQAFASLRKRARVQGMAMGMRMDTPPSRGPQDRVIDAEFEEVEPPKTPTHQPSGWTKH